MPLKRTLALAAFALLVAACGGNDSGASSTTSSTATQSTTISTSTTVPDTTTTTLDPSSLGRMLAALDTDRSTPPTLQIDSSFGPADDATAVAITQELETALGVSVSGLVDLRVFPVVGSSEILLVVRVPTGVEDDDAPTGLLEALVVSAAAESAGVTMLVVVMTGTDEIGPFEITMAIPWTEARATILEGAELTARAGVQITRNGQVVNG